MVRHKVGFFFYFPTITGVNLVIWFCTASVSYYFNTASNPLFRNAVQKSCDKGKKSRVAIPSLSVVQGVIWKSTASVPKHYLALKSTIKSNAVKKWLFLWMYINNHLNFIVSLIYRAVKSFDPVRELFF